MFRCHKNRDGEKWRRQYEFYHGLFPEIPTVLSEDLISKYDIGLSSDDPIGNTCRKLSPVVLVDVRTMEERNVSKIPTSICLAEFEKSLEAGDVSPEVDVIIYCTIGYRSGLEARRLRNKYLLRNVYSLDGIVAYTHQKGSKLVNGESTSPSFVVKETICCHTFASMWSNVGVGYTPVTFNLIRYLFESLKVAARSFSINLRHYCITCLRPCPRRG